MSPHVLLKEGNTTNQLEFLLVTLFIFVLLQGYATTPNTVCSVCITPKARRYVHGSKNKF